MSQVLVALRTKAFDGVQDASCVEDGLGQGNESDGNAKIPERVGTTRVVKMFSPDKDSDESAA